MRIAYTLNLQNLHIMSQLEPKEAIKILTAEKKKTYAKLVKAYDSYCLFPNPNDQRDYDEYNAVVTALEMAIEALKAEGE